MSKVSRSVYQKLAEKNKQLLLDIKIITTEGLAIEKVRVIQKWRKRFAKDNLFRLMLKEAAREYIKNHPEYDIRNFKPPTDKQQTL